MVFDVFSSRFIAMLPLQRKSTAQLGPEVVRDTAQRTTRFYEVRFFSRTLLGREGCRDEFVVWISSGSLTCGVFSEILRIVLRTSLSWP